MDSPIAIDGHVGFHRISQSRAARNNFRHPFHNQRRMCFLAARKLSFASPHQDEFSPRHFQTTRLRVLPAPAGFGTSVIGKHAGIKSARAFFFHPAASPVARDQYSAQ